MQNSHRNRTYLFRIAPPTMNTNGLNFTFYTNEKHMNVSPHWYKGTTFRPDIPNLIRRFLMDFFLDKICIIRNAYNIFTLTGYMPCSSKICRTGLIRFHFLIVSPYLSLKGKVIRNANG